MLHNLVIMFTALHIGAGAWYAFKARKHRSETAELTAQHHEKCVMLGLIAGAVLWRS